MNIRTPLTVSLLGVAAALALSPPAAADASEDYFLGELYKTNQKWYWPFGESYIIGVGRGVCTDWDTGVAYPDEVDALSAANNWMHRSTRYFIALSTAAFCPQRYASSIPPEGRLSTQY